METAAVTNRNTLAVTNLPVGPRLSSPSTNGSKRPKSAMPSSKVPKPNSPRNHGLLGPICWRNPVTAVDFLEVDIMPNFLLKIFLHVATNRNNNKNL